MNSYAERIYNGVVKENPTFVLALGMCPTLAVTTSLINGIGMGLTTTVVLIMSNVMISLLRKVIPDRVRVPIYIVIVASFVTIVQFILQAYLPSLNDALGIYIPLIVVNCIILGRAEAYASKNSVGLSACDGIGMGLGFTVALGLLGAFRELLGSGSVGGIVLYGEGAVISAFSGGTPISIMVLAPGAFFVLAFLVAAQNRIRLREGKKPIEARCCGDCAICGQTEGCESRMQADVANGFQKASEAAVGRKAEMTGKGSVKDPETAAMKEAPKASEISRDKETAKNIAPVSTPEESPKAESVSPETEKPVAGEAADAAISVKNGSVDQTTEAVGEQNQNVNIQEKGGEN